MSRYPTYEECYAQLPESSKHAIELANYEKAVNGEYMPYSVYGVYDMHNVSLEDNASLFEVVKEHAKSVLFEISTNSLVGEYISDFCKYCHTNVTKKRLERKGVK